MQIKSLIQPLIPILIPSLLETKKNLFSVGVLLETTDGDVLYTTDDALMTIGGPQQQSTTRPPVLLYTTDNSILFTTDYDTLTV